MKLTTIVRKAKIRQDRNREVWAWCLVNENGVGFSEIHYTESDGVTPVDTETEIFDYAEVLFQFESTPNAEGGQ